MGESQNQPFQFSFNRFLRVDFQGSRVTSDGGLLLVRELDERLALAGLILSPCGFIVTNLGLPSRAVVRFYN